jgi:hypothetical protein
MFLVFNPITSIFQKICGFFLTYFSPEYQLKLEYYRYSSIDNAYNLFFRVRTKSTLLKFDVKKIFFDARTLKLIHPGDCYVVGIIYGMCQNQVEVIDGIITEHFNQYATYQIIEPTLFVDMVDLQNETNDIVIKAKQGNKTFKVNAYELAKQEFLLHGIGNFEACKLGFCISEKFIAGMV